jgi:hypothetical protein
VIGKARTSFFEKKEAKKLLGRFARGLTAGGHGRYETGCRPVIASVTRMRASHDTKQSIFSTTTAM